MYGRYTIGIIMISHDHGHGYILILDGQGVSMGTARQTEAGTYLPGVDKFKFVTTLSEMYLER